MTKNSYQLAVNAQATLQLQFAITEDIVVSHEFRQLQYVSHNICTRTNINLPWLL